MDDARVNALIQQALSDPSSIGPAQSFPSKNLTDGDVPVWDASKKAWVSSSIKDVQGRQLGFNIDTKPPPRPGEGDLWIYPWSIGYWMFVYDVSETTYKWKFVGGSSLYSATLGSTAWAGSASTWQNIGGVSVTVPRAGDYEMEWNGRLLEGTTSGAMIAAASVSINSTTTGGAGIVATSTSVISQQGNLSGSSEYAGLSAGDVLRLMFWQNSGATNNNYDSKMLKVRPIRVS